MYLITIYDGIDDKTGTVIHSPYPNQVKLSKAIVHRVVQGISDMSFTLNLSNPAWAKIKPLRTLIKVEDIKRGKKIFDGRVLKPKQSMDGSGMFSAEYTCESKLAYLNDSNQRHGEYHNISVRDFLQLMIDNHNRQVEPHKRFKVGNITVQDSNDSLYRYLGYEKTYATIKDKLIDRLGGYLVLREEADGMYLDYLESVGEFKNTPIKLRTNLKDMQREIDPLEVITRLVPLGANIESEDEEATDASQARVTIASVNNGIDYLDDIDLQKEFGIIEGALNFDDVTLPSNLINRGNQFLANQKAAKVSYSVSPVDVSLIDTSFDAFECGNWHQIINPVFAVDEPLQIVEQTIDVNNPQNAGLIIGEKYRTLTQYQIESNKSRQNVVALQNTVTRQAKALAGLQAEMQAVDNAIGSIQGALVDSDLPGLEQAIADLEDAIDSLNSSIGNIPIYDIATPSTPGLMSAPDKSKLNLISIHQDIDLDSLKSKFDQITVAQPVDLDNLLARVTALEGGTA